MRKLLIVLGVAGALGLGAVAAFAVFTGDRPHLTPSTLPTLPCPQGLQDCRGARGRVVFVEKVDPDGDGDLHLVLVSRQSVTAPGISVVKVPRERRPVRIPSVGDSVSAAGVAEKGSKGEALVRALRFRSLPR